jgi:hypothetical protein
VEEVVAYVLEAAPADQLAHLGGNLDPNVVASRARTRFEARSAGLWGRPLTTDTWNFEGRPIDTPGGRAEQLVMATRLERIEEGASGRVAVVQQHYGTVPGDFADAGAAEEAAAYFERTRRARFLPPLRVRGSAEFRVEVKTGILLRAERHLEGVHEKGRAGRLAFEHDYQLRAKERGGGAR